MLSSKRIRASFSPSVNNRRCISQQIREVEPEQNWKEEEMCNATGHKIQHTKSNSDWASERMKRTNQHNNIEKKEKNAMNCWMRERNNKSGECAFRQLEA